MILYNSEKVQKDLKKMHYAYLDANSYSLTDERIRSFNRLKEVWSDKMPDDIHLRYVDREFKEGKSKIYRKRTWGQFRFTTAYQNLEPLPYRPFVNLGITRETPHWPPSIYENKFLHELIRSDFSSYCKLLGRLDHTYLVNVILFRVFDGNPSPEGLHNDDVLLFSVRLINYINCQGGEGEVYEVNFDKDINKVLILDKVLSSKFEKTLLKRISLSKPLDTYFVHDNYVEKQKNRTKRIYHKANKTTRVSEKDKAIRDVLIVSFLKDDNYAGEI